MRCIQILMYVSIVLCWCVDLRSDVYAGDCEVSCDGECDAVCDADMS